MRKSKADWWRAPAELDASTVTRLPRLGEAQSAARYCKYLPPHARRFLSTPEREATAAALRYVQAATCAKAHRSSPVRVGQRMSSDARGEQRLRRRQKQRQGAALLEEQARRGAIEERRRWKRAADWRRAERARRAEAALMQAEDSWELRRVAAVAGPDATAGGRAGGRHARVQKHDAACTIQCCSRSATARVALRVRRDEAASVPAATSPPADVPTEAELEKLGARISGMRDGPLRRLLLRLLRAAEAALHELRLAEAKAGAAASRGVASAASAAAAAAALLRAAASAPSLREAVASLGRVKQMGGKWYKRARGAAATKKRQLERVRQRAAARRRCHREAKLLTKTLLLEGFPPEEVVTALGEVVSQAEVAIDAAIAAAFDSPTGSGEISIEALSLDAARDAIRQARHRAAAAVAAGRAHRVAAAVAEAAECERAAAAIPASRSAFQREAELSLGRRREREAMESKAVTDRRRARQEADRARDAAASRAAEDAARRRSLALHVAEEARARRAQRAERWAEREQELAAADLEISRRVALEAADASARHRELCAAAAAKAAPQMERARASATEAWKAKKQLAADQNVALAVAARAKRAADDAFNKAAVVSAASFRKQNEQQDRAHRRTSERRERERLARRAQRSARRQLAAAQWEEQQADVRQKHRKNRGSATSNSAPPPPTNSHAAQMAQDLLSEVHALGLGQG